MQISIAMSHWYGSRFWFLKHHKYRTITENHLGYPVVVQSQGDLAARQGVQEQDLQKLLAAKHLPTLRVDLCACSLQAESLPLCSLNPSRVSYTSCNYSPPCWGRPYSVIITSACLSISVPLLLYPIKHEPVNCQVSFANYP